MTPFLARTNTVVAMDRRGRGASGPLGPDHSLEAEYGDVAAVAGAVDGPVHVVGHSSGARFALHAALLIPGLASLVLYEPPPPETFADGVLEALEALGAAGDREGILRTFIIDVAGNDSEALAFIRTRPIWPIMMDNALTLPAEMRAASGYRFEPSVFARLAVPTLCLLGEHSGPELGRVARTIVGSLPDACVRTLPGQGHGAMFSAPELLAAEVGSWVSRAVAAP